MRLAVASEHRAVGVEHDCGVVVKACGAPLEKRGDQHDAEFAGQRAEPLGHRPRNRIGEVESPGILRGAEIGGQEKLLGCDDAATLFRRLPDEGFVVVEGFVFRRP